MGETAIGAFQGKVNLCAILKILQYNHKCYFNMTVRPWNYGKNYNIEKTDIDKSHGLHTLLGFGQYKRYLIQDSGKKQGITSISHLFPDKSGLNWNKLGKLGI